MSSLSGGCLCQRVRFTAQALLGSPRLLALDEPTAELDGETARKVSELILEYARKSVVVMTTHLADTLAQNALQVLRVERGQVSQA